MSDAVRGLTVDPQYYGIRLFGHRAIGIADNHSRMITEAQLAAHVSVV